MKNLKVLAEVKKKFTIFIQENACCRSLDVCLRKNEKSTSTLLFEDICVFYSYDG